MSEPAAPPESSQAGLVTIPASGNGVHEPPAPPTGEDALRDEPDAPAAEEQPGPDAPSHHVTAEQPHEPLDGAFKAPTPAPEADAKLVALEERVRRLEDVLASLQLMEPAARARQAEEKKASNSAHFQTAAQVLGVKSSAPPPSATPILPPMPTLTRRRPWLLHDIYADLRAILRMFVDPRYRLMWLTKLLVPIVIGGMLFSWFVISAIPVIGPLTDRGLQLVMAFVLFKVLIREATHYRETSPDLPPSLRL